MVAVVYRNGKLGVELSETLNQMIESKDIPIEMHEQVMQSFDKRVNELLKDNWCKDEERITNNKLQGRIENGVIRSYRNVNNTWTFELEEATFRGQAFVSTVKTSKDKGKVVRNIHVVIIDQKQAELARPDTPPRVTAGAGAGAADGDSAPAMTADSWDDWEDDPSGQPPPPPPAGHVGVEQAQAQRQARAEEQAQAAAREQYTSANQTSLAMASGAGSSLQPAAAAAEEDEDLDDWEGVDDGDNPLDDTPANKKRKRAGGDKDAQDDFDYGDELNTDDDGMRARMRSLARVDPGHTQPPTASSRWSANVSPPRPMSRRRRRRRSQSHRADGS